MNRRCRRNPYDPTPDDVVGAGLKDWVKGIFTSSPPPKPKLDSEAFLKAKVTNSLFRDFNVTPNEAPQFKAMYNAVVNDVIDESLEGQVLGAIQRSYTVKAGKALLTIGSTIIQAGIKLWNKDFIGMCALFGSSAFLGACNILAFFIVLYLLQHPDQIPKWCWRAIKLAKWVVVKTFQATKFFVKWGWKFFQFIFGLYKRVARSQESAELVEKLEEGMTTGNTAINDDLLTLEQKLGITAVINEEMPKYMPAIIEIGESSIPANVRPFLIRRPRDDVPEGLLIDHVQEQKKRQRPLIEVISSTYNE